MAFMGVFTSSSFLSSGPSHLSSFRCFALAVGLGFGWVAPALATASEGVFVAFELFDLAAGDGTRGPLNEHRQVLHLHWLAMPLG